MPRIHIQALKLSFKGRGLKCIDWAKTGGVVSGSVARKQVTFFFSIHEVKRCGSRKTFTVSSGV